MLTFDKDYTLSLIERLLSIDSPSGFTGRALDFLKAEAAALGYTLETTKKGGGLIRLPGRSAEKTVGLCAHLDTLGLMVRAVKSDGSLAVTKIGGPIMPTLDGEYCRVYTRGGAVYTGTILSASPAAHVYSDASERKRDAENMMVRLDELVKTEEDTRALGISAGDYVCIDTKTVITPSGFIKSRFLDDKLSVGLLMGVLQAIKVSGQSPQYNTVLLFSVYEEVGHGMSYLPEPLDELVGVDMGCIGDDLRCTEYDVSICAKDSTGPYDYELTGRLAALAAENSLQYAVDIYPYYGSDVSAAREGGHDLRGALIGPGVHASHGMERSHYQAADNSMRLIAAYLGL